MWQQEKERRKKGRENNNYNESKYGVQPEATEGVFVFWGA